MIFCAYCVETKCFYWVVYLMKLISTFSERWRVLWHIYHSGRVIFLHTPTKKCTFPLLKLNHLTMCFAQLLNRGVPPQMIPQPQTLTPQILYELTCCQVTGRRHDSDTKLIPSGQNQHPGRIVQSCRCVCRWKIAKQSRKVASFCLPGKLWAQISQQTSS